MTTLNASSKKLSQLKGDLLIIPYLDGALLNHPLVKEIEQKLKGSMASLLKKVEYKGKTGEQVNITSQGLINFDHIIVYGLGKTDKLSLECLRRAASNIQKAAGRLKAKSVTSLLSLAKLKFDTSELGQAFCEGHLLGAYQFTKYKSKPEKTTAPQTVEYVINDNKNVNSFKNGVNIGYILAQAVNFSRDLGNIGSDDKPPVQMAKHALSVKGVRTKVHYLPDLKRMGMNGIVSVGKGSIYPPVMVEMHYKPAGKIKQVIAIVGKGITFDSGGLSLKPAKSMEGMKDDMSGAGNVIGIMQAIGQMKPKGIEVRGYFPAAENMPSGSAIKPGDVYTAYNGVTVEVLNTDAEGRLALGDVLSYAIEKKPDVLIDMATLTGACLVALGELYAGILGTDQKLIEQIIASGEYCGEKFWQLPMAEEYDDDVKSSVADIKNVGGGYAGTITAALFLKRFVGNVKWAHIDIAGPSFSSKDLPYCQKGCTGFMVRTMVKYLMSL